MMNNMPSYLLSLYVSLHDPCFNSKKKRVDWFLVLTANFFLILSLSLSLSHSLSLSVSLSLPLCLSPFYVYILHSSTQKKILLI
ncbi:hypothetical protein PGIGA_G00222120 [Pangasianodon gigas]|uniref:Uncharacterized protein n=1 Tax=Pangasianodon gigas TaxID=30993 RepID=A0ACC5WJC6_PANGG|nr:hypothetical protein [Pangasianodon gigas]